MVVQPGTEKESDHEEKNQIHVPGDDRYGGYVRWDSFRAAVADGRHGSFQLRRQLQLHQSLQNGLHLRCRDGDEQHVLCVASHSRCKSVEVRV